MILIEIRINSSVALVMYYLIDWLEWEKINWLLGIILKIKLHLQQFLRKNVIFVLFQILK